MSDRLHEIIGEISVIHKDLINDGKIKDIDYVLDYVENYDEDIKEHYLKLLLQYYFQENQIENIKELLILGYKFDLRMQDIKLAFLNIKSNDENVIELLEDNVVFFKDTDYEEPLKTMYEHYRSSDEELQTILEETIELIKRNRYVCAYSYKNKEFDFARFFLNEDLLDSLKRDLPYLLR